MKKTQFQAMGSQIFCAVDSEDPAVLKRVEEIPGWFDAWENSFSRFRPTSEISLVNWNNGRNTQVSAEFIEVLKLALQMEKWTNGLFTPSILPALEQAGYTESFEKDWFHQPLYANDPLELSSLSDGILLNETDSEIQLPSGLQLDFGGIAKSWAAHQTMSQISKFAPVLANAGGDIAVSGPQANGEPWPIAITDPFNAERDLCLLMINKGGVATSGRDRRKWLLDGQWKHHIIDPRINTSAETDILTATVVADDAMTAEVAAKIALILGSRDATEWFSQQSKMEYLLVLENKQMILSSGFNNYLWREACPQIQTA